MARWWVGDFLDEIYHYDITATPSSVYLLAEKSDDLGQGLFIRLALGHQGADSAGGSNGNLKVPYCMNVDFTLDS